MPDILKKIAYYFVEKFKQIRNFIFPKYKDEPKVESENNLNQLLSELKSLVPKEDKLSKEQFGKIQAIIEGLRSMGIEQDEELLDELERKGKVVSSQPKYTHTLTIIDGSKNFSQEELEERLNNHPSRFHGTLKINKIELNGSDRLALELNKSSGVILLVLGYFGRGWDGWDSTGGRKLSWLESQVANPTMHAGALSVSLVNETILLAHLSGRPLVISWVRSGPLALDSELIIDPDLGIIADHLKLFHLAPNNIIDVPKFAMSYCLNTGLNQPQLNELEREIRESVGKGRKLTENEIKDFYSGSRSYNIFTRLLVRAPMRFMGWMQQQITQLFSSTDSTSIRLDRTLDDLEQYIIAKHKEQREAKALGELGMVPSQPSLSFSKTPENAKPNSLSEKRSPRASVPGYTQ